MSLALHVRLIVGFPVSRDDFHDADDKPTAVAVAYANRYGIAPSDAWEVALDRHVHCFDPVYGWDHCPPTRYAMGTVIADAYDYDEPESVSVGRGEITHAIRDAEGMQEAFGLCGTIQVYASVEVIP